uniref:Uncharacterized protein n=1 Tax=Heterorhabditis bacteriophora TaxID=37862 RepID=A0A1I7X1E4_HETBA
MLNINIRLRKIIYGNELLLEIFRCIIKGVVIRQIRINSFWYLFVFYRRAKTCKNRHKDIISSLKKKNCNKKFRQLEEEVSAHIISTPNFLLCKRNKISPNILLNFIISSTLCIILGRGVAENSLVRMRSQKRIQGHFYVYIYIIYCKESFLISIDFLWLVQIASARTLRTKVVDGCPIKTKPLKMSWEYGQARFLCGNLIRYIEQFVLHHKNASSNNKNVTVVKEIWQDLNSQFSCFYLSKKIFRLIKDINYFEKNITIYAIVHRALFITLHRTLQSDSVVLEKLTIFSFILFYNFPHLQIFLLVKLIDGRSLPINNTRNFIKTIFKIHKIAK